jgi:predicted nucleic acid-binding protein
MAVYFLDSSALVKRYVAERGSGWVWTLTDPAAGHRCWITAITPIEAVAAFYRRARAGTLTVAQAQQAEQQFLQELPTHYQLVTFSPVIVNRALALVAVYPLRAYDAVQLSSALHLRDQHLALGLPALVFLSADQNLNQLALTEGLQVDDPNQHP